MKKILLTTVIIIAGISAVAQIPAPPTGLTLTALSPTSMQASWNASAGASYYYFMLTDNATCPDFDDKDNECVNYFNGPNPFSSTTYTFTGLDPNTNYWLIVAAVNSGWEYNGVTKIATPTPTDPATAPAVTTAAAIYLGGTSATLGGTVTDDGGDLVTRGVVYSTTDATPTIAEGATQNTNGTGTGSFSETISSFSMGQTYYVQAYAINSHSTVYGGVVQFSTNTPPVANSDSYTRFYTNTGVDFTVPANGVLGNDTDADTDPLTVGTPRPASGVSSGTLTLNSDGSFTYRSNNGLKDVTDSFTYYANDGTTNSTSAASVTLNIVTPRFTGAGANDNFSNPANWNTGYVPNEQGLDIIIASGQNIDFDVDYTCNNLKFESGASFNCVSGHILTITGNVLDRNNVPSIVVSSSIKVSTSLSIDN